MLISSPNSVSASLSSTSSMVLALASSAAIFSSSASAFLFFFGGSLTSGTPSDFADLPGDSDRVGLIWPGSSIRLFSMRSWMALSSVISGMTSGSSLALGLATGTSTLRIF